MGKHLFIFIFVVCFSLQLSAQTSYETSYDTKEQTTPVKILKGVISKSLINNDTSFNWYNPSHDNYFPDSTVTTAFKKAKQDSVQFILFGGTWCEDTQFILPKFFKLQEASGISDNQITFFGVDRGKKTLGNISTAFNITNVPTIIVMKDGKEIGRVVEYGKSGKWDAELAGILSEP
jgi:thiol-disulfide isomerase/thioredoxin